MLRLHSFRSFFDDWSESSWNIPSRGTKVPQKRKFLGAKFLGTFAPKNDISKERMFHVVVSSMGTKVLSVDFSLPGTKVQRNEKAWIPDDNSE